MMEANNELKVKKGRSRFTNCLLGTLATVYILASIAILVYGLQVQKRQNSILKRLQVQMTVCLDQQNTNKISEMQKSSEMKSSKPRNNRAKFLNPHHPGLAEEQPNNRDLQSRVEELEVQISACHCQKPIESSNQSIQTEKLLQRLRRQLLSPNTLEANLTEDDLTENQDIQRGNNGISRSNIGLLWADPKELNRTNNASSSQLEFRDILSKYDKCSRMMQNGRGDLWCIQNTTEQQRNLFMLRRSSTPSFPFLTKAAWMDEATSQENFAMTDSEGKCLQVKKSGLYIATSSMQFVETGTFEGPLYGVFVRRNSHSADSERPLSFCSVNGKRRHSSAPEMDYLCSTWQLALLKAGDEACMKIGQYLWFRVQKETFFLALIKLDDWPSGEFW